MERRDNLLGVLQTLFRWKQEILAVCFIALVGSVVISLLLPVYYRADTVFLAASPDQAKPEMLYGRGTFEPEFYGTESDIDRLLTIAESSQLVNFMIDSFDLYAHYRIDSTEPRAPYRIRQKFFDLYQLEKTKRDAIELSIEDRDARLAAQMANAARARIDELAQQLIKDSQLKSLRAYEWNLSSKEEQLTAISDTLRNLRSRYGIFNVDAQSEALTEQFAVAEARLIRNRARLESLRQTSGIPRDSIAVLQAMVNGQEKEVETLQKRVEMLNDGMGAINTLTRQYLEANQSLSEDMERRKIVLATFQSSIPAIILVEPATIPVVKSRPKRLIIVLAAVAIAFFFSVLGVLLIESYKEVNWREITHAK